jgi:hypothetical protein
MIEAHIAPGLSVGHTAPLTYGPEIGHPYFSQMIEAIRSSKSINSDCEPKEDEACLLVTSE